MTATARANRGREARILSGYKSARPRATRHTPSAVSTVVKARAHNPTACGSPAHPPTNSSAAIVTREGWQAPQSRQLYLARCLFGCLPIHQTASHGLQKVTTEAGRLPDLWFKTFVLL